MKRGVVAVVALLTGCTMVLGPDAPTDPQSLYDDLWREFDRRYSYFQHKHIDWRALGDAHRPAANATPAQLFDHVTALLDALDDPHVSLRTPFASSQSGRARAQRRTFYSQTLALTYVSKQQLTPSGRIRFGQVAPRIGYVRIPSFSGEGWGAEIDGVLGALEAIEAFDAIVIDARDNGGGNNRNSLEIANRFADETRTVGFFRYRSGPGHGDFTAPQPLEITPAGASYPGPLAVLCNRRCASATEDFLLRMRAIPGVLVIGDTSMGAVGNPIQRELANGWAYQLSEWMVLTPDMEQVEDAGLIPNIVAPGALADSIASVDRALERAVSELTASMAASARRPTTPP